MSIALYHFHATQIKRSAGQSAIAAAAYRAGEKLHSEYYGDVADYTRKDGVVCSEILLPAHAPPEYADRETLWNAVESIEKHPKAQLAYSFDIALQNEFSLEENVALARQFCLEQFVGRGMIADLAVHAPEKDGIPNPHFHVLCPIRPIEPNGKWGTKQRREYVLDENGERVKDDAGHDLFNAVLTTDWGRPETLEEWRAAWAELVNAKFAEKGLEQRIDHRSYERQGIDQIPTVHEGPAVRQMEQKGIRTDKGDHNRFVKSVAAMMKVTGQKIKKLLDWLKEVNAELAKAQEPNIIEFLNRYYGDRNTGAWSQKARLGNLKNHSEAVVFLQDKGITTLAEFEQAVREYGEKNRQIKAAMKRLDNREKELADLLQLTHFYAAGKPVYDKLNTIKFKKARAKFAAEHEKELHFFYLARRKLKPYFNGDGKLPISRWKKEQEQLKAERTALSEQYKPLADEVRKLWQIKFAVESAQYDMEREQQTRTHKYELER